MRLFIGIIIFFTVLAACSSDEITNYEVGSDFLDNSVGLKIIDTFTIKTGTFKLDELVTSSTGRILLGNVSDENFGAISSQTYFQVSAADSSFDIDDDAEYDSIGFVLNYDRYYVGDTLQPQTYKVYRITETVEPEDDDESFFNTSSLEFDETDLLGEITFTPRPNRASDSIYIPIKDALGEEIFNSIQDNDINNSDDFIQEYKGITIVPDDTSNSHILGFSTSSVEGTSGNSSLRVFYTIEDGDSEDNDFYFDMVITDTSKLFNAITSDFTGSDIANIEDELLDSSENTVYSSDTDDLFYIQGGSGISTKIEMRSLKKVGEISEFGAALDAELTFKPIEDSYRTADDLQDSLFVFVVDSKNRIQNQLTDIDGNTAYAILNDDPFSFKNYYYSINMTGFVDTVLNSETDLDYGLMIQFNDLDQAVESTILDARGNSDSNLKLSIKYLNY